MKNEITPRSINITSDDGHYTIKGRLMSLQDCYSMSECERKNYKGSHWVVSIMRDGKYVNGIQVMDGDYQPYIHFGKYACGICQYGVKLSKNTILFAAVASHMFKNALKDEDTEKIERKYWREYVKAKTQNDKTLRL